MEGVRFMEKKKGENVGTGSGIVFGTGIGIVFGILFNELVWGIIIGSCAGVALGSAYDWRNKNKGQR